MTHSTYSFKPEAKNRAINYITQKLLLEKKIANAEAVWEEDTAEETELVGGGYRSAFAAPECSSGTHCWLRLGKGRRDHRPR